MIVFKIDTASLRGIEKRVAALDDGVHEAKTRATLRTAREGKTDVAQVVRKVLTVKSGAVKKALSHRSNRLNGTAEIIVSGKDGAIPATEFSHSRPGSRRGPAWVQWRKGGRKSSARYFWRPAGIKDPLQEPTLFRRKQRASWVKRGGEWKHAPIQKAVLYLSGYFQENQPIMDEINSRLTVRLSANFVRESDYLLKRASGEV